MDGQTRPTLFVIWGVLFLLMFPRIAQADDSIYTVKNGDTVYTISKNYGVTIKAIEITNNISHHLINVGQELVIPQPTKSKGAFTQKFMSKNSQLNLVTYRVKPGESLYRIAKGFNISVNRLIQTNKLKTNILRVGQKLEIPKVQKEKENQLKRGVTAKSTIILHRTKRKIYNRGANNSDLILLAKIINAESGGEDYIGQVAVGAVILNRLDSRHFPKSIKEIIYERTRRGGYQFTPVANGAIHKQPSYSAINAAKAALAGKDPTQGALFFYNPQKSNDKWIRTRKPITKIGNHVFAK